jgi:hypothetical protein
MKTSSILGSVTLAAAVLLLPSIAAASQPIHLKNTEQGYVFHPDHAAPASRASATGPKVGEVAQDGFRFVGGDQAWQPESHRLVLRGGEWVHADTLSHNAPRPSLSMSDSERRAMQALYTNG